jgi:pimeloyl-ACP methyl ester carboxylesterase
MSGLEERSATIRGTRLRYFVGGDGPPLLLVHGLGGASGNWADLATSLARRHRVLVPDLPGHGRSEPLPSACGLASYADRLALLAEAEEALPGFVAGHSLGGAIATRLTLRFPQAVAALVLVSAPGLLAFPVWRQAGMAASTLLRPVERLLCRHRGAVATSASLRRLAFGYWGAVDAAALSASAVFGLLDGPEFARDTKTARMALIGERCREELAKLRCPTLLVWGARDRLVPLEVGFEYARRLGAPLRVVPGAGHLVIVERPAECANIIEGFLTGAAAAP